MPSRRFYISGRTEFHNLRRTKGKALSLSRKRKVHLEEDEDEDEPSLGRIAQDLQMVSSSMIVMALCLQLQLYGFVTIGCKGGE